MKEKWKEKWKLILACAVLFYALVVVNIYLGRHAEKQQSEKTEIEEQDGTLQNVWISKIQGKKLTALVDGEWMDFALQEQVEEMKDLVGDLQVQKGEITKIVLKEDTITGKVQSVSENSIEIDGYGELPIEKEYRVYQTYDKMQEKKWSDVLVGYKDAKFVVADGKICATLLTKPVEIGDIRVLLKRTEQDPYFSYVTVTSDDKFEVETGLEKKTYKPGQKVKIKQTKESFGKQDRVKITTSEANGKITLLSSQKTCGHPSYRGSLEVVWEKKEGILVINELPIEQYLYGVVGSEMPESYGLEALKAQAVCARSYACKQLLQNSCGTYGAHVDDTVAFQVYNNIEESENVIQAVKDTAGQVMKEDGEIVTAYYFATSCGYTADAKDVWQGEENSYLLGDIQMDQEKAKDVSREKAFKEFLENKELKTYDSEFPWYRWTVTLSEKQLTNNLDILLEKRYESNPEAILTKQKDGSFLSEKVGTVGTVKEIKVLERAASGVIKMIEIVGTKETIQVRQEYNIRVLLEPGQSAVYRQDNSKIEGMQLLPSGFFVIDHKGEDFVLTGGGYGHGVGMSQTGAKAMADAGYTYQEILSHYYKGVEFSVMESG